MRTCFVASLGLLLVDTAVFWFIRLLMNDDVGGKALLFLPLTVHIGWGLVLLVILRRSEAERAAGVGALIAWIFTLPLACYSNFILNFHLTW
ncbi:MAG TPA: hypothetical protein VHZ55_02240 [Bryobacteraceae bacterium]|nr:hypothetical protein [Bryobacteraceae bacterium]